MRGRRRACEGGAERVWLIFACLTRTVGILPAACVWAGVSGSCRLRACGRESHLNKVLARVARSIDALLPGDELLTARPRLHELAEAALRHRCPTAERQSTCTTLVEDAYSHDAPRSAAAAAANGRATTTASQQLPLPGGRTVG